MLPRFAVLSGPINHLKHLASPERLPFSVAYVGSLVATIYFSVGVSTTRYRLCRSKTNSVPLAAHILYRFYHRRCRSGARLIRLLVKHVLTPPASDHCAHHLHLRLLPWRNSDHPVWRSDAPTRRRQCATFLVVQIPRWSWFAITSHSETDTRRVHVLLLCRSPQHSSPS